MPYVEHDHEHFLWISEACSLGYVVFHNWFLSCGAGNIYAMEMDLGDFYSLMDDMTPSSYGTASNQHP